MFLFKYCCISDEYHNTENIVQNSIIRLNSPSEFNDPFDLNIKPRADLHDEDFKTWIETQASKPINEANKDRILQLIKSGEYKKPEIKTGIIEGALNAGIRTHGVYCFSKLWDSILMWSHYGNKHKGICITYFPHTKKLEFV